MSLFTAFLYLVVASWRCWYIHPHADLRHSSRPLYCLLLTTGVLLLLPFLVYGLSPGQEVDGDWQQRYRSIVSSRTSRRLPSLFVRRLSLHRTQPCWGHVRVAFEGRPDRARVDGLLVSKAKVFEVIPVPVRTQEIRSKFWYNLRLYWYLVLQTSSLLFHFNSK